MSIDLTQAELKWDLDAGPGSHQPDFVTAARLEVYGPGAVLVHLDLEPESFDAEYVTVDASGDCVTIAYEADPDSPCSLVGLTVPGYDPLQVAASHGNHSEYLGQIEVWITSSEPLTTKPAR